jgi:hypothetical protein
MVHRSRLELLESQLHKHLSKLPSTSILRYTVSQTIILHVKNKKTNMNSKTAASTVYQMVILLFSILEVI